MLWGEIKVDSDDLKHMVHRNGGFIELYNNIMTCLGDLGLLLAVPPWGREQPAKQQNYSRVEGFS